jgi:hypothetical protein
VEVAEHTLKAIQGQPGMTVLRETTDGR